MLTARADGILTGRYDTDEAIRRIKGFDAAGADCLYAPLPSTMQDLARVVAATAGCGRPRWAKLSANTDRVVEVAGACRDAGAEAVTLINTLLGLVLDPETLRPALGNGGGGLSGRAIHPVAVRAVHDVREAFPEFPIVGVGGVASGWDAVELMVAGAQAVQVGTASFADPRACARVAAEMASFASDRGIARLAEFNTVV